MKYAMCMAKGVVRENSASNENEKRENSASKQNVILPLPGPIKPISP